jgi:hypothetical protein
MKCPFFQVECLKEGCTAYKLKDEYIQLSTSDMPVVGRENVPYCEALNTFLPERK